MTADELNDRLDAMIAAAGEEPDKLPGLITVRTEDWIYGGTGDVRATCKALNDGLRHRDVVIKISTDYETKVFMRSEASGRGEPYRDPLPRP
ncbi:hypothetical protein [Brevundimonas sp. GCM10030266]|uniref:hypothetical protein n=1 Tax=Brevundimonas sp. GCM10030266 TaxID=3273386 RepID=UPI00361AB986